MNEALLILGMALVTFAVRYPVLALVGRLSLPASVLRALRYVPPAVLAAIILPALVFDAENQLALSATNSALLAGIFTFVVAWRTKNVLVTIIAGMIAFWLLKALFGQF